jgi:hypothetical protein
VLGSETYVKRQFFGSFQILFQKKNATILNYCNYVNYYQDSYDSILQQDGAPPHFHREVHEVSNRVFPHWWIGRHGPNENPLLWWPPRSPDLTSCDFFLWGYVNHTFYVPPLPRNLQELQNGIVAVLGEVTTDILQRVWQEIDYQMAVCRVTRCAHIEVWNLGIFSKKRNSVALVRKRTTPTEQPPLVGEVSANFSR